MESPFTVDKFDHFVLHVRDLRKSLAFYSMFNGGVEAPVGAHNTPLPLGPTTRLLLHHDPDYVSGETHNLNHFALLLESNGDIEKILDYVRSFGAEPFDGPKDNGRGQMQFRVHDPDGNEIELRIGT